MYLAKAIIRGRKENKYKVRIPLYHGDAGKVGAVSEDQLPYATVCTSIKGKFDTDIGDVVYVMFEKDEPDMPVILGFLYL